MSASKQPVSVPHDALVLVCDGRKSLMFRNAGSAPAPRLQLLEQQDAPPNPSTHDQGADRPGRADYGQSRRSAVGQTDWHDAAERDFISEVAKRLDGAVGKSPARPVVIVAPPRALATLRDQFSPRVRAAIAAELAADLTKHTVSDIETRLIAKESP